MTMSQPSPLLTFAEAWATEFISSVEMFAGTKLTVAADVASDAAGVATGSDAMIWIEQPVARGRQGRVWIGVPASGLGLVEPSASDPEAQLALMREVLDQSVKSAAQALNIGACPGFQCVGDASAAAPPPSGPVGITRAFQTNEDSRLVCVVRGDAECEALLATEAVVAPEALATPRASGPSLIEASPATTGPAVFDRFAGVELPVSVVLGRATLKVRDVLKLAVGSLIELDTRTTDPVDVCVHDGVVARGEVVSIRGNYGIRILELTNQRERLSLQLRSRHPLPVSDGAGRQARVH